MSMNQLPRKKRSRPWTDEHMARNVGWTTEAIPNRRLLAGFNYKEIDLPYGTFVGEDK